MHIQFDVQLQCIQISTRINSSSVHTYILVCFIRNVSNIQQDGVNMIKKGSELVSLGDSGALFIT